MPSLVARQPLHIPSERWMLFLALARQRQLVFHSAASLEDVAVAGRRVPLADDIGRAELERRREDRGTGPLNVLARVRGAFVCAA